MFTLIKILAYGIATIAGAAAGAVGAFFATVYTVMFLDQAADAQPGDGIAGATWILLFFTVPFGIAIGVMAGTSIVAAISERFEASNPNADLTDLFDECERMVE